MKVNVVMLFIALAIAALVAFGFYAGNNEDECRWLLTIGSGVMVFVTLSGIIAVNFGVQGSTGNVRAISIVFLLVSLISNIIFGLFIDKLAPYVIVNGILLVLYVLIGYSIVKALKDA